MRRLVFLITLSIILNACNKDYDSNKSPFQLLPQKTNSVIIINEVNDFLNGLENQTIFSSIYIKELKKASTVVKHLSTTNPIFISFYEENNSDYLILTKNDSALFVVDSIPNHISESLVDLNINKIKIYSSTFYHKTIGNVFASSNNLELIKNLNAKNEDEKLSKLIETANNNSVASIVFKPNNALNYSKLLLQTNNDSISLNKQSVIDLSYTNNSLIYNGIITSSDSIHYKIDCFKNTIPQKVSSIDVAPYHTTSLKSITFDDFSVIDKNRSLLINTENDSTPSFLNFTNEIALIDNAVVLSTLDAEIVLESIEEKSLEETYKDIDIYRFENADFFKKRLLPFITFDAANFFIIYKDFIVFSKTTETLKSIITNALNNNTLANSDAFKNIQEKLSDESSLFIFKNAVGLAEILKENTEGYNANAVQFIYEDNYAHVNGIIQKFKKRAASNTVTEAFTTSLDSDLILPPQTIKNHINKAHDIIVQDVDNNLYLISSSGNVLWKKKIHGKILGNVEQIDTYKNGRLQLVFATSNRLYKLDRNGNDVSNFPIKFRDEVTQPLSVFDYDKKKNYRLLITQGKNLLMYDANGKSVSGFKYANNGANITTQPKHFRVGSKDYIAFTAGENIKILNRQGSHRINVNDKIQFSDNALFLYKNKFTTTNLLGQLVQVDTKGKLSLSNLNLPEKHSLETTSKTLVSLTENKLNIKSRTVDLDYGDYTNPKIFYLNDKIYVSTTDLQAKKVYLYDSQAKPIANFPVFGTSSADLQKLDNEKGLELVTQVDSKTIAVYKLH